MKKKLTQLRWLVTMILFVTAMAMPKMAWAEITPKQPSGNGTADSPYQIGTPEELYWFAALVNGTLEGETQNTSANAVLTADISNNNNTWTPIGNEQNPYTGTFDGQGHTISGLNFNNIAESYVGLFGNNSGTIKNVGVVDSYFKGDWYVGGVCGLNENGTITGCYNTGDVRGNDWVGGVCGLNENGTITGCYNTAGMVSGSNYVGGVCGFNNGGIITGCYNTAGMVSGCSCVGGVCGVNECGTITSCYTNQGEVYGVDTGNVTEDCGVKTDYEFTDGTVCSQLNTALKKANASVRFYQKGENYPELIMNVPSIVGGLYQISNKEELYAFALLVNNGETSANAVLTADITVNSGVLKSDGTLADNYSDFETWTPIGNNQKPYTGTFDGKGKTISGLYYSEDTSVLTHAGLFGYNNGTISNITIKDSRFYLSSSVNFSSVAAIVGRNEGTVKYCYNTGTINGTATATHYVGGICGYNKNQITNCDNSGIVNCTYAGEVISMIGGICGVSNGKITDCNNAGKVSVESNGKARVGGVCGSNYKGGTTENCHNTADVNVSGNTTESCAGGVCGYNFLGTADLTSTISNCSNTGNITGISYIGGVCGNNYCQTYYGTVIVINCYNTGTVSGTSYVGGVCGRIKEVNGQIINCYNTGTIKSDGCKGSVCGFVDGHNTNKIANCYFDTSKYSGDAVGSSGGIIENVLGKTSEQFASGEVCYLLNGSTSTGTTENPLVWYQNLSEGGDASPVLKGTGNNTVYLNNRYACICEPGEPTTCYTNDNQDIYGPHSWENGFCAKNPSVCQPAEQNTDGVYEISNAGQLYWFAGVLNNEYDTYKNAYIVLTDDIVDNTGDVAGCNGVKDDTWRTWIAIGKQYSFQGTFDGQGHTISGLFGNGFLNNNNGTIKNLSVLNSYLSEETWVGGICNHNQGTISGCSFSGSLMVKTFDEYGEGVFYLGGICGQNWNIIENCHINNSVQFYTAELTKGKTLYIGGICGQNELNGKVSNCYSMENITCQTTVSGSVVNSGICGQNTGVPTNCYYLTGTADSGIGETVDVKGSVEAVSSEKFASGEVTYLLNAGKAFGNQAWGQQLGTDNYPVLGSEYKIIKSAKGDKDANNNDTYWATFSNLNSDVTLSVPSARNLNVYNATVSKGTMTLTKRADNQVAKGEGVLLKTDSEYVNAKANETDGLTAADYANNNLVATPATEQTIDAETGYTLYRLTYNNSTDKTGLGFYLGLVKDSDGNVTSSDGSQLKATPGKAYLKVSTGAATNPATTALARSFVFPGDDETTGIGEIVIEGDAGISGSANAGGRIYNLQGQQVTAPVKGLYIMNNKKVVIK